jgi:membrane protein DedA with SNARE-associated domain
MRIDLFILYTSIGAAVWTALFVWLGFTLGDNLGEVNTWLRQFSVLIILAIVAGIGWHFREVLRKAWRKLSGGKNS